MTIPFGPRSLVVRFAKSRVAALLLTGSLIGLAQAAPPVTAAIAVPNGELYNRWMADVKGCQNVRSFKRDKVTRPVVEAILTCQALKLGGYDGEFKLNEAPNYARALLMAAEGQVSMPAESLGNEDFDEKKFFITKPLLLDGDIRVALYVMADKLKTYNVKTVEDLAGCATDDLVGWTERKDGETKHEPGYFDGLNVAREEAEAIVMQARLKAGWITEAELAAQAAPAEAEAEAEGEPA